MQVHNNRDLKTEWSSPRVPIRSPPSSPLRSPKREVDPLDDAFLTKIKKEPEDEKIDTAQQSSSWSGQPSSPAKDYEQLHPRKRKLRNRESTLCSPPSAAGASPSQDAPSYNGTAGEGSTTEEGGSLDRTGEEEGHNFITPYEAYFNIRKQIEQRRRQVMLVTPKPPAGFKEYLLNTGGYVLQGNPQSRLAIPMLSPPPSLQGPLKDLFVSQEKDRYNLRLQHLVEKEKFVLAVEQEILRVHARAAREMSHQIHPFSICTFFRDENVFNPINPEQEDKERNNARSRYNGRLFISWLQDVDDKWEKVKEAMVLRHHNEAESLHAVQRMEWEWKLKEQEQMKKGVKKVVEEPIDSIYVPMIHVSEEFNTHAGSV
ncbi:unnamed protein product [Cyprideis torosa]|uniref:Uncharacterized protein n=1 Tax=Cyprideis torosa TaxID=163714 RepID=A0A7R8W1G6_9CRUS|nr:unnamed protein product [Cyprideis torosa]CAG0880900.1 unnamed protein product [Cyprideis torosa]